jgi:acetate kinase
VVHGGEDFCGSVLITDEVMKALNDNIALAPLHNPPNIMGIEACQALMPKVPQVGVFDTAFHSTMPPYAYLYGIPYEFYQKYKIRRYGFHGTSHKYVSERAVAMLNKPMAETKIITCHLGNGASIAAVKGGKSIDTSMGFTPTAGLVMSTRSGDLDPGLAPYLARTEQMTTKQFYEMVNHKSGLLGVSETSSDMRDLLARQAQDIRAAEAVALFCYQAKKWIGAFAAALGGLDTLVFAGGIGENAPQVRSRICEGMGFLGLELSESRNAESAGVISTDASRATVRVIRTDEDLMIARSVRHLLETDSVNGKD